MTRADIHRPSVINPEDYEFVGCDYYGPHGADIFATDRIAIREHMARTGGKFSGHEHGGSCHICGAHALHVAKFYHPKTNSYIVTGHDCADKMHIGDPVLFRSARKRAEAGRIVWAGKAKAEKTLEAKGLAAAWAIYANQNFSFDKWEETTVRDIVSKLVQYGSISEKQESFLASLLVKIADRAKIEAQRAAEKDAAAPVPTGRQTVTGKVLTRKQVESYYGNSTKILVQSDAGWKVFGTCPSDLNDCEKGDIVTFTATIEPSKDDAKFGFFSRPSKASFV